MFRTLLIYLTHPHVGAWNLQPAQAEPLRAVAREVHLCPNSKTFLEKLPGADAVIVWFFKKEWLETAKELRWIATPAAGSDWIEAAPTPQLRITHGEFHGPLVAESLLSAMLYFCRALGLSRDMQKERKWGRVKISEQLTTLRGARVTCLGFGRIGQAAAKLAKSFGARITGVRRSPMPRPDYFSDGDTIITPEQLPSALGETDHLILALPGGAEVPPTAKLLDALRRRAFLYNVGRGDALDESALHSALTEKRLAGAYLDVFAQEPLAENSPLWTLDNLLIQPHLSAVTPRYMDLFVDEAIDKFRARPEKT